MTVRDFAETDFAAVCRVYLDAKADELAFEGGGLPITPLHEDPAILAAFRESAVTVFDDGQVVGFAATFGTQLRALFVHGGARGRGIGGALLRAALDGADQLSVNVAKSNVPARRFYARHGFVAVGDFVRRYGERDIAFDMLAWRADLRERGNASVNA